MCSGHSARRRSAPVSDPSPPQTTRASMPCLTRLSTAARRPFVSRKAAQRAVPISVPPALRKPRISSHPTCDSISRRSKRNATTYPDDVPPLQRLLPLALLQQLSLAIRKHEASLATLRWRLSRVRRIGDQIWDLVPSHEPLPPLTNHVHLASSAGSSSAELERELTVERDETQRICAIPPRETQCSSQ